MDLCTKIQPKATPVITARLRSFLCRCTRHVIVLAISRRQPFSHILTLNQLTELTLELEFFFLAQPTTPSMTTLLEHSVAHPTEYTFLLKTFDWT